jgi:hypothetical protein
MNDQTPGMRIESAASVTLIETIQQHMGIFAHVIRRDKIAGQSVVAAYVSGLSAAAALVIAGRQGSREDVIEATIKSLREAIERDLKHLGGAT